MVMRCSLLVPWFLDSGGSVSGENSVHFSVFPTRGNAHFVSSNLPGAVQHGTLDILQYYYSCATTASAHYCEQLILSDARVKMISSVVPDNAHMPYCCTTPSACASGEGSGVGGKHDATRLQDTVMWTFANILPAVGTQRSTPDGRN